MTIQPSSPQTPSQLPTNTKTADATVSQKVGQTLQNESGLTAAELSAATQNLLKDLNFSDIETLLGDNIQGMTRELSELQTYSEVTTTRQVRELATKLDSFATLVDNQSPMVPELHQKAQELRRVAQQLNVLFSSTREIRTAPKKPLPPLPANRKNADGKDHTVTSVATTTLQKASPLNPRDETAKAPKHEMNMALRLGLSIGSVGLTFIPLGIGSFLVGAGVYKASGTNTVGSAYDRALAKALSVALRYTPKIASDFIAKATLSRLQWLNANITTLSENAQTAIAMQIDKNTFARLSPEAQQILTTHIKTKIKSSSDTEDLIPLTRLLSYLPTETLAGIPQQKLSRLVECASDETLCDVQWLDAVVPHLATLSRLQWLNTNLATLSENAQTAIAMQVDKNTFDRISPEAQQILTTHIKTKIKSSSDTEDLIPLTRLLPYLPTETLAEIPQQKLNSLVACASDETLCDVQWLDAVVPHLFRNIESLIERLDLNTISQLQPNALNHVILKLDEKKVEALVPKLSNAQIEQLQIKTLERLAQIGSLTETYTPILEERRKQNVCKIPGEFIRDELKRREKTNFMPTLLTDSLGKTFSVPPQFAKDVKRASLFTINGERVSQGVSQEVSQEKSKQEKSGVEIYKDIIDASKVAAPDNPELLADRIACIINQGFFADIIQTLRLDTKQEPTGIYLTWEIQIDKDQVTIIIKNTFNFNSYDNPEIPTTQTPITVERTAKIPIASIMQLKGDPLEGTTVTDIYLR